MFASTHTRDKWQERDEKIARDREEKNSSCKLGFVSSFSFFFNPGVMLLGRMLIRFQNCSFECDLPVSIFILCFLLFSLNNLKV